MNAQHQPAAEPARGRVVTAADVQAFAVSSCSACHGSAEGVVHVTPHGRDYQPCGCARRRFFELNGPRVTTVRAPAGPGRTVTVYYWKAGMEPESATPEGNA